MSEQQKISSYFKQVKDVADIEPIEGEKTEECVCNQFYKNCLKQQQEKKECPNELCVKLNSDINQKREQVREKIYNIEEAIRMVSMVLSEKNEEIERLKKQVAGNIATNSNRASRSRTPPKITPQTNPPEEKKITKSFAAFTENFTEDELAELRSTGDTISKDSTFIFKCMKYLYKQNVIALKDKSVTGKSTKGNSKEPVTPKKYEILSQMLTERIHSIVVKDSKECQSRIKALNSHIKNAINNINRSTQKNDIETNACKQLEFDTLSNKK